MKEKMLLKKICSTYASDLHFATMIFPFINRELEMGATIRTVLEKDEQENIEKILKNIGLNSEIKEEIKPYLKELKFLGVKKESICRLVEKIYEEDEIW